jgi:hypothetical protein
MKTKNVRSNGADGAATKNTHDDTTRDNTRATLMTARWRRDRETWLNERRTWLVEYRTNIDMLVESCQSVMAEIDALNHAWDTASEALLEDAYTLDQWFWSGYFKLNMHIESDSDLNDALGSYDDDKRESP